MVARRAQLAAVRWSHVRIRARGACLDKWQLGCKFNVAVRLPLYLEASMKAIAFLLLAGCGGSAAPSADLSPADAVPNLRGARYCEVLAATVAAPNVH